MKTIFIILTLLVLIFIVAQSFQINSSNKTEQRAFSVLHKEGKFELRKYAEAIMATVNMKTTSSKEISYSGFRTLAGYIFGGNDSNQSIAMTAPVQIIRNDSNASMSFIMPASYKMEALPKPNNNNVKLHKQEAECVAVICFGGVSNQKKIKKYTSELIKYLDAKKIKHFANFRYLGYNPPFQLIARRNEIIVGIDYK